MNEISKELKNIVNSAFEKYIKIDENTASKMVSNDKWSLKEIIGHLIDSASNNHQRFVRMQRENSLDFPLYHYDWIKTEKYNEMKFSDILMLWKYFNILLSHLIENVDSSKLDNYWNVENEKLSLKDIMIDYLRHINEHLEHFEKRLKEVQ